jgi:hypothetical protein
MNDDPKLAAEVRNLRTWIEGKLETLEERIENNRKDSDRNAREIDRMRDDTRKKLDSFDGELSDSKVHMLNEIKSERDELAKRRTDSGIWWKRTSIGWVVSAVAALALLVIGTLAGFFLHR